MDTPLLSESPAEEMRVSIPLVHGDRLVERAVRRGRMAAISIERGFQLEHEGLLGRVSRPPDSEAFGGLEGLLGTSEIGPPTQRFAAASPGTGSQIVDQG